ncbi:MAG: hypothetical protein A2091_02525 [Desulfuromonadales bacterium GWD2_61_12]|nr:MAG: hypothetical protein A2005_03980 [Desulfuromonadales bacterium GWC2_61_20]OGR35383.1 MAG: hypothetical protein A2091_02525 [Desulfuromonadales bacterium GWD2_61_12]HAD03637.1 epimerase [Desulfuromonas sp.]HBT83921.1 epimerase [Desulfuromonas sp.]
MRIAILGATSHIAKGLIAGLTARPEYVLLLYARNHVRVEEFIKCYAGSRGEVLPMDVFGEQSCDVVINCIGIGDPGRLKNEVETIFRLTEAWDNRILQFLSRAPETLYIHFSSGAAYGVDFSQPVGTGSRAQFPLNALTFADFYGIAKLNAEAKHRAASSLNIVDLRIFSYFSRFMDLNTRYLLSDIVVSLQQDHEFLTTPTDIVRDYVHPEDLLALVELIIARRSLNAAYDVYSLNPISKFELLRCFAEWFGLKYRVASDVEIVSATGMKDHYYSRNTSAMEIGYQPKYDSLTCLRSEIELILGIPDC